MRSNRQRFLLIVPIFLAVLLASCGPMEVPLPGADESLYQDEFVLGRTGNWLLESDQEGTTAVVPENLLIEINEPGVMQYATLVEPVFADFVLEVDARLLEGSPANSYGVLFRMQSPQEFYRFEITGDGMYVLERHEEGGTWVRLMDDWRDTVAINRGRNVTNRLKVEARGPEIAVYVNDMLLERIQDGAFPQGNVALDAGTFNSAGLQVAFDNLFIYPASR